MSTRASHPGHDSAHPSDTARGSTASPVIVESLRTENSVRRRRAVYVLLALVSLAAIFPLLTGFKVISSRTIVATLCSVVLLMALGSTSYSSRLHLRPPSLAIAAILAMTIPWLSALTWADLSVPFFAMAIPCFVAISLFGVFSLVIIRATFGRVRRRFGGARILQGGAAAVTAAIAIGLHCPLEDALHLVSHVLATAGVTLLLSRVILPE